MTSTGHADIERLYRLLDRQATAAGGPRSLADWEQAAVPRHGVYFFYDPSETTPTGRQRIVRVGTDALTSASRSTLWTRLSQHRGPLGGRQPGVGNHRGSIFRQHVGSALLAIGDWPLDVHAAWHTTHPSVGQRAAEEPLELAVTSYLLSLRVLLLDVPDRDERGLIERASIALLSARIVGRPVPPPTWLGYHAGNLKIRDSGLWNVHHVGIPADAAFLDIVEQRVDSR